MTKRVSFPRASLAVFFRIGADAWFERRDAERFEIFEQTVRVGDNEALSLLVISDDEMLEDLP